MAVYPYNMFWYAKLHDVKGLVSILVLNALQFVYVAYYVAMS